MSISVASLLSQDPNKLSYHVTEAQSEHRRPVSFELLSPADEAELRGCEWTIISYARNFIGDPKALKLVLSEGSDTRVQGLVSPGAVEATGSALIKSFLVSAPWNWHEAGDARLYRGMGVVLVAHLVVESYRQGGAGKLLIRAAPNSVPVTEEILRKAANQLLEDREKVRRLGPVRPGLAEYLDLIRALTELYPRNPVEQDKSLKKISGLTFRKNPEGESN